MYNEKVLGGSRIMKEEGLQYLRRLEKLSMKNGGYLKYLLIKNRYVIIKRFDAEKAIREDRWRKRG